MELGSILPHTTIMGLEAKDFKIGRLLAPPTERITGGTAVVFPSSTAICRRQLRIRRWGFESLRAMTCGNALQRFESACFCVRSARRFPRVSAGEPA